nr:hypothetical protein [uncultured Mucilaginibacter sp.]
MKYFATFLLLTVSSLAFAQQKKITNNIDVVTNLNINGNDTKVSIGKIIIQETLQTKLYLIKSEQKRDSTGYLTTFYFGNNERLPLFGTAILIKLDSKIITVNLQLAGLAMYVTRGIQSDNKSYLLKAQQINRDADSSTIIVITVKTENQIHADIYGLDGVLTSH